MFLSAGNRCDIHSAKPDGCVQYPYTTFPFGLDNGTLDWFPEHRTRDYVPNGKTARDDVERLVSYRTDVRFFILLGQDQKCPGLKNKPISIDEYMKLMREQCMYYLCKDIDSETCSRHR